MLNTDNKFWFKTSIVSHQTTGSIQYFLLEFKRYWKMVNECKLDFEVSYKKVSVAIDDNFYIAVLTFLVIMLELEK